MVSASALIATSKAPYSEYASESAEVDFVLAAGQSQSYMLNITHAEYDDSGRMNVNVGASISATDNDTALTITLSEASSEDVVVTDNVDTGGLTILAYGDYSTSTIPQITLTMSEDGGGEGTLRADVSIDWYTDTPPDTSTPLIIELVPVERETEETGDTGDTGR
jgi:hypothetical protein